MKQLSLEENLGIAQAFFKAQGLYPGTINITQATLIIRDTLGINKDLYVYTRDIFDEEYGKYRIILKEAREFSKVYAVSSPLVGKEHESFMELLRWNGYVLAAKIRSNSSVEFVTWQTLGKPYEYRFGHYFDGHYSSAKEDFAIRSGLISLKE